MRNYDIAMNMLSGLKPEEFPGDMKEVAAICGEDVARALMRHFSGGTVYVSAAWIRKVKRELIKENYKKMTVAELEELTGYRKRSIYRILRKIKKSSQ